MQVVRVERGEIIALTGLRFIAAFYVFVFHIHLRWPLADGAVGKLISKGAVGMTVFFMLSGFILAYTYSERNFTLRSFYLARVARIYPVYVLAGLFSLPWLLGLFDEGAVGAAKVIALVFTNTLMIQAWFPQMFSHWNNGAAWSLSAEAFFYLIFPFMLFGLKRLGARGLIGCLILAYILSIFPGFVYAAFKPRPEMGLRIFYAMPIFRLPEFIFGASLYVLSTKVRVSRHIGAIGILSVLFLTTYLCVMGKMLSIFVLHNWVVVPVTGIAILSLAHGHNLFSRLMSSPLLVYGGRISYCFYSFQFAIISTMLHFREELPEEGWKILMIAFALLSAMSVAGYHLVEEPFRKIIRRRAQVVPAGGTMHTSPV